MVLQVRKSGMRTLKKSEGKRKEPLSLAQCCSCVSSIHVSDLFQMCIMVSFVGLFRYADATAIYADGVKFVSTHMEITLDRRNNYHFRGGETICIQCGRTVVCPVFREERTFAHFKLSGDVKVGALASSFSFSFKTFVTRFGLQSFRSEGASQAAADGVADHISMAHGGWWSHSAMATSNGQVVAHGQCEILTWKFLLLCPMMVVCLAFSL